MPSRAAIFLQEFGNGIDITVTDVIIDPSQLSCLHGQRAEIAGGDGVHAKTITEIIEMGDLSHILDHAQATERVDGLILGPLDLQVLVSALC